MFKKIISLICTVSILFCLTACTGSQNSNLPSISSNQYPLTITDSDGNTVSIEKEPQKVISGGPNITEIIYSLGAQEKLVGRTDYCNYPEAALDIPSIGVIDNPSLETILSLEPDIVIASTHFNDDVAKQLTDLGIPILYFYVEHDLTGVYDIIKTVGAIVNATAKADELVNSMKLSIDNTVSAVKGLPTPTVYYVAGYGEYGEYTAGGDTFIGQMITLAGGKNIANDITGWTFSLEKLVESNPEIIILPEYFKEGFTTSENYKNLDAVKNGKVYVINVDLIERQDFRNAEGLETLAKLFHPEAFN